MYQPTQAQINLFIDLIRTSVDPPRRKTSTKCQQDTLLKIIKNRYQERQLSESIQRQFIKLPNPSSHKTCKKTFYQLYQEEMVKKHQIKKSKSKKGSANQKMHSLRYMNNININVSTDTEKSKSKPRRNYYRSEQTTPKKELEKKKYFVHKKESKIESDYLKGIKKCLNNREELVDSTMGQRKRTHERLSNNSSTKQLKLSKIAKLRIETQQRKLDLQTHNIFLPRTFKKKDLSIDPWSTVEQEDDI